MAEARIIYDFLGIAPPPFGRVPPRAEFILMWEGAALVWLSIVIIFELICYQPQQPASDGLLYIYLCDCLIFWLGVVLLGFALWAPRRARELVRLQIRVVAGPDRRFPQAPFAGDAAQGAQGPLRRRR